MSNLTQDRETYSEEQILEDVQKMVATLKDQKYYGPYAFSLDGRVWYEVKEEEDGKVVLNHRPKKRKSRNRLKKLAKTCQR